MIFKKKEFTYTVILALLLFFTSYILSGLLFDYKLFTTIDGVSVAISFSMIASFSVIFYILYDLVTTFKNKNYGKKI